MTGGAGSAPARAHELAERLAERIDSVVPELLPSARRIGGYWSAGNVQGDTGGSLYIHRAGPRSGRWVDAATGQFGDMLDLINAALFGTQDLRAAIRWTLAWLGLDPANPRPSAPPQRRQEAKPQRDQSRRNAFIQKIWLQTWNSGTVAAPELRRWLQARGIDDTKLDLERLPLRWSPRCPRERETAPAMIALMTNPVTVEPCGLHRTFLLPDGSGKAPVNPVRQTLGRVGIIRLSPDDEVELGLGICEGIETGLSLMAAGWRSIWACGPLDILRDFPVLGGIECLTIFADPKPNEVEGARACAARWKGAGREVRVYAPPLKDGDWNDVLKVTG